MLAFIIFVVVTVLSIIVIIGLKALDDRILYLEYTKKFLVKCIDSTRENCDSALNAIIERNTALNNRIKELEKKMAKSEDILNDELARWHKAQIIPYCEGVELLQTEVNKIIQHIPWVTTQLAVHTGKFDLLNEQMATDNKELVSIVSNMLKEYSTDNNKQINEYIEKINVDIDNVVNPVSMLFKRCDVKLDAIELKIKAIANAIEDELNEHQMSISKLNRKINISV